jgi:hypothetical protein
MNASQTTTPAMNSSQSDELSRLRAESQSLKVKSDGLRDQERSWNRFYWGGSIAAVIVAGLLGGGIWLVGKFAANAGEEARPLEQRREGKEARIRELLDQIAEGEIAQAQEKAAIANLSAGKANERAGILEEEAAKERTRASQLEKDTGVLKEQNLKTESLLNAANESLEKEKLRRLELEKTLAPRELPLRTYDDGTTNVDDLTRFGHVGVVLEYAPDVEAVRTASNLGYLFDKAGWKVISANPSPSILFAGVKILAYDPSVEDENERNARGDRSWMGQEMRSLKVCETVQEWLLLNSWQADVGNAMGRASGPNEIIVQVGVKPSPYFEKGWIKRMRSEMESRNRNLAPNANNPSKKVKMETIEILGVSAGGPPEPKE